MNYWTDGKKPTKTCPENFTVEIKTNRYAVAKYKLINRSDVSETIPDGYFEDASFEDLERTVGLAAIEVTEQQLPETLFWEYNEDNLLPSSIGIPEFAKDPSACVPLKNMFILAGISDISTSLPEKSALTPNQFQNYLNNIARKTTSHFRDVWKDYKDIEFSLHANGDRIVPGIKEKNTHDMGRRSDGFKRFVTFLLLISVNVKTNALTNTLLLIDEPDTSLHPSGARYLRDELIRISKTNYVLYSTHSIFMIDSGDIGRHYIVRKKSEITTVESAEESNIADEEVLYNAVGYSVFSILKEKNIIFEGWHDKRLFQVAVAGASVEMRKKFNRVGLCHGKGVKSIKTITPMIELAGRECLILSDSDKPAKDQQKAFRIEKGFGEWRTYQDIDSTIGAVTGEDFVKNSYLVKHTKSALVGSGMPPFDETILPEANGKIAAIKNWLSLNGMNADQADATLKKIKSLVFEELKPQEITSEYHKLLKGISVRL